MLKAEDEKQMLHIKSIFGDVYCEIVGSQHGVNLDGFITFEQMANVVDFLRNSKKKKKTTKDFTPPTVEEVAAYIKEKGYHFDAKSFVDYYEADDWHYGKGANRVKMSNWKRSCSTWESQRVKEYGGKENIKKQETSQREELLLQRFYETLGMEEARIYGMDENSWYYLTEQQKNYHRRQPEKKAKLLKWIREHDG